MASLEPNDPNFQSKVDQTTAFVADMFPPMWRRMYTNLIDVGFEEELARHLLTTYIIANCATHGINFNDKRD